MTADAAARSLIIGVHCTHGHFNDPKVPYCSVCGLDHAPRLTEVHEDTCSDGSSHVATEALRGCAIS